MKKAIPLFPSLALLLLLTSCYSFKGISINPNANTFYVAPFEESIATEEFPPPADLAIRFTERLKDKIRGESRLKFKDVDPDLDFTGKITKFTVSSEAPKQGEQSSFSRLTIGISVEYIDHKATAPEPKKNNFSFFKDFPSDQNLLSVQDDLIDDINKELTEMVFNWAFNNW
jgi:Lipopolysaccharide-assembly